MADGSSHTVLFVPDVFASRLCAGAGRTGAAADAGETGGRCENCEQPVWPIGRDADPAAVSLRAEGICACGPVAPWLLRPLREELAGNATVSAVAYDWRHGIAAAAQALGEAVEGAGGDGRTVSLAGHGLGALGVLRWMAGAGPAGTGNADTAAGRREALGEDGRVVLLAPPLDGAEAILAFCLAKGRLFRVLAGLSPGRHPSAVLAPFLHMRGLAELLPDRALDLGWWDAAAQDAPWTDAAWPEILEQRDELRRVAAEAAGGGRLHALYGAAEATLRFDVDDDGDLAVERAAGGDGWMLPPAALPGHRVAALHPHLPTDRTAAAATAGLLLRGETDRAAPEPPAHPPGHDAGAPAQPSPGDLLREIAGHTAAPTRLRVEVAHGSLDRLKMPVTLGHYDGDEILGAERFLDGCLGGRLGHRHALGDYPGPAGTAAFVAADAHPPGALVVGLGDIGELTTRTLSRGVAQALVDYALDRLDRRLDRGGDPTGKPTALPVASLLIGTRGGRQLSIRQSVVAITRGALLAQRALAQRDLLDQVTLERLVFVELWSDIAIAAGHALEELADDPGLGRLPHETVEAEPRLRTLEGRRGTSPIDRDEWSWWRRVIVSEEESETAGSRRGLRFVSLGERSRAEERLVASHRTLVDDLIRCSSGSIHGVGPGSVATTLFQLLLPNALKDTVYDGDDLVLVLDDRTSRYPWELLARRGDGGLEPLISQVSVIRQFRTPRFREGVVPAATSHALVVAAPAAEGMLELRAARDEGAEVVGLLENDDFRVNASLGGTADDVVQRLFQHDYRMVHVAAHGLFRADDPSRSGVVIGGSGEEPVLLTADVFRQLPAVPDVVFLNCCHLAGIDRDHPLAMDDERRTRLAAGLARTLIEMGVRCVVAAGWAVEDRAARTFAVTFYRSLLAGAGYGAAVRDARQRVWRRHGHTTTWGAYQCYGDPTYRLPGRSAGGGDGRPRFVALEEAVGEISDLCAKATHIGSSDSEKTWLQERLRQIEEALETGEPEWFHDGELRTGLARAWKEAGDPVRAIDHYAAALRAWDGKAPVRAAEQLANLLDRYGDRHGAHHAARSREGGAPTRDVPPLPRPAGTGDGGARSPTEAWLDWADRLGDTPERAALRGAAFKRQAMEESGSRRYALLRRAGDAYLQATAQYHERHGEIPYYQGLNAAALVWVTGDDLADRPVTFDELLDACRRSARSEQARGGTTLWNTLALHDADLLGILHRGEPRDRLARELRRRYRRTLRTMGSESQVASSRGQLDFLIACATGDERGRFKTFLQTIAEAFPS